MEFNKSVVLPGENVDINLTASPGSVCAIGVVDKSVNILGGKHQITPEQVSFFLYCCLLCKTMFI